MSYFALICRFFCRKTRIREIIAAETALFLIRKLYGKGGVKMENIQKGESACNYRAYTRDNCESPIRYAMSDAETYRDAKMYNKSEGGMYFESESNTLRPGSELCIKMVNYSHALHEPEAHDGYRAEVVWCRKIKEGAATPRYGVGVRFTLNVCDKCGSKVSYQNIRKTDKLVFLCSDCFETLEKLSDGKIKESVENYLIGNVI